MAFEDIVKSITDEADRTSVAALAVKYPVLKDFAEMGEKAKAARPFVDQIAKMYNRQDLDLPEVAKLAAGWENWKQTEWDAESKMTVGEKRAKAALDEVNAQLTELQGRGETEMTIEEVNQHVAKILSEQGVVTREELKKVLPLDTFFDKDGKSIVATKADVMDAHNRLAGRFSEVYGELTPEFASHYQDFKEPIDFKKVEAVMIEYAKNNGGRMMGAKAAYREAYRDKFETREKEQRQAEITAAEARGEEKARKSFQQSSSGHAIPVDSRGGLGHMGPIQKRYVSKQVPAADGKPVEAPLGKGMLSRLAAQEHAEKQNNAGAA